MSTETIESTERRVYERFSARFPAKFKDTREEFGTNMFLTNASAQGAQLTSKEHLYINDKVALEVNVPDGKSPLIIKGQVVWVKREAQNLWDVGIKFHEVRLMSLWRLYKYAIDVLPTT